MARFTGKSVLITGGTTGIGRASAIAFAREGARVALTGRRRPEGEEVVRACQAAGGEAIFLPGDVTSEQDVQGWVAQTVARFGRLDIAFNNAGVEITGPIVEARVEDFRRVFDINVLGVLLSMKHEIPAILRSGGGSIINNASIAGSIGMPGVSIYIASKHAVIGLTRTAAVELARQNIRVNAVSPGAIETPMFDRFAGDAQSRAGFAAMHPIGRVGTPEEIARPVLFLASEEASFVTGLDLRVDGGFTVP